MKVLFLDIDGVLSTRASYRRFGIEGFDPDCAKALRRLVEEGGFEIVVSSTWRRMTDWELLIRENFKTTGWIDPPIIDRTPLLIERGAEIAAWLAGHPEVEDYLVVDDDDFDLRFSQRRRMIKTTSEEGLTEDQVDAYLAAVKT